MSGAWAIVPLLPTIVVIVVTAVVFAVIFSVLGNIPRTPTPTNSTVSTIGPLIAALIGAIILTYLSYFILLILVIVLIFKLVSRRNNHFNRQILLQEDLVSMARELAAKKGVDVSILLNNMERGVREARLEETEKNATLYAIVGGAVWLYAAYFLMTACSKCEGRWALYVNDILKASNALRLRIKF